MLNPNLISRLWARRAHKSIQSILPREGWVWGDNGAVVWDNTAAEYPYNGLVGERFALYSDGIAEAEFHWNSSYWDGFLISPDGETVYYGNNPLA